MQPSATRRIASSRRMAQFFMQPPRRATGRTPAHPSRRGESPIAALYENRFRCMDEVTLPGADCHARHEPLARYLAEPDHVSASMLRRFARGEDVHGRQLRSGSIGEALHTLLLEPRRFEREYWVPSLGEAIDEDAAANRTWLTPHDYDRLRGMRDAILDYRRLPLAEWLECGAREWSVYWSDTDGARWKARPDCFTEEVVLEVKTTTDVRPHAFARARQRFRHDLQGAHYLEGLARLAGRTPRFLFVSVENVAPHYVWIHELGGAELEAARKALGEVREAYRAAQAQEAAAASAPAPR